MGQRVPHGAGANVRALDSRRGDASALEAYDEIASRYDLVLLENRINAYMRRTSLCELRTTFRPGMRVLDIGCGSGDEAIALAALGVEVVAIDPSQAML